MKPISRLPLALDKHFAERAARIGLGGLPPPDALALWRLTHLRTTVRHAARHSLFYRDRLDDALSLLDEPTHTPEVANGLLFDILGHLPQTFGSDLAADSDAFLAVGHGETAGVISLPTSGTTGPGKRIYCTESDLRHTRDFFRWGMQLLPAEALAGPTALLMSGNRPGSVGDLLGQALTAGSSSCAALGFMEDIESTLAALLDLKPSCLVGVPGQLFRLSRRPESRRLRPYLRAILCSGDTLSPPVRQTIAHAFKLPVFAHYGLTETGLGGAVECPELAGCHMREADMIFEILDAAGSPLPPGAWGELTLTTLTRAAMPLLRYRTGDEARVLPASCPCGSLFGRIQVRGRLCDTITLSDNAILTREDLENALFTLPFIEDAAFTLRPGRPRELTLRIQPTPDAPTDAPAVLEKHLRHRFKHVPQVCIAAPETPCHTDMLHLVPEWPSPTAPAPRSAPKRRIHRITEP